MIDDTDRQILSIIQGDARMAAAEVARQVGMAPSAVFERMRKLEERGVIRGYTASIEPGVVGLGLLAFVLVGAREASPKNEIGRALAAIPGVQEVHHIAGSDDYIVKVRTAGPDALGRLLREKFRAIPGLRQTRTTIVLETIKESGVIPLDDGAAAPGRRAVHRSVRTKERGLAESAPPAPPGNGMAGGTRPGSPEQPVRAKPITSRSAKPSV